MKGWPVERIDMIVWSKDRPAQLDLLLRSAAKFFRPLGDTFVLYKATSEAIFAGYQKCIGRHNSNTVRFEREGTSFLRPIVRVIPHGAKYVLGNSDDNVFVDEVAAEEMAILRDDEVALSLRLNPQVSYCQPAQLKIECPEFASTILPGYRWRWTDSDPAGCWGYPHPCDSNVYRSDYLYKLLLTASTETRIVNPTSMEVGMNLSRHMAAHYPYMRCLEHSKLVSIANNTTSTTSACPSAGESLLEMNERWMDGEELLLEPLIEGLSKTTQCHVTRPYEWGRA
jgi:hypothetical protein